MTTEYLNEQKLKYQQKQEYFSKLNFDRLSNDFKEVVDLISEMEKHIKENFNFKGENTNEESTDCN